MITLKRGRTKHLKSEQPYISGRKKSEYFIFVYTEAKNIQNLLLYKVIFNTFKNY